MSDSNKSVVTPSADPGPIGKVSRPSFKRTLTFFGFFAITASMVMTVYEYPSFASSGFQLVFFLIVGGILWFLPVAMCAAEMATVKGWESGGIFAWVGNTLGRRWGFAALFYQWFQITVGFVTMSFFILAAFAYVVKWDALYNNPLVMFFGVAAIVWILTLTQLGGTKFTARISKVGFVGGIIVPVLVLLVGLIIYFATGGPLQITMDVQTFVPNFGQVDTLVIFASFILAYMGVEASASHVNELKNPNRNYPLAMIVLAILTIALDSLGGLAVATTLPANVLDGNLSFGVIEAFRAIYITHIGPGLDWLVFIVALLLALGVLAEISAWIVGPSRALLDTAHDGILPPSFKKTNKHGVSVQTVVIQAILVTMWDAVLCGSIALSGGSSSSVGYLTAIGLTVVIYLVGYVLFFLGYFYLIFKKKNLQRSFQLPGGTPFKAIVAGAGLIMTIATLIISFFPSSNLDAQSNAVYQATLGIAFVISVALPFIIYGLRHRWAPKEAVGAAVGAGAGAARGQSGVAGTGGAGTSGSRMHGSTPGAGAVNMHGAVGAPPTAGGAGDAGGAAVGAGASASVPHADSHAKATHPAATGGPTMTPSVDAPMQAAPARDADRTSDHIPAKGGSSGGRTNKRSRARDAMNNPRPAGASGSAASGGVGGRVASGISAAVVSVTSRPSGPISVDSREMTLEELDVLRTPGNSQNTSGSQGADNSQGASGKHNRADARAQQGSGTSPRERYASDMSAHSLDDTSVDAVCAAPFDDERQSAQDTRDDVVDRMAKGDPSLRGSVTDGVVGGGIPQADADTPDPQRETGPDTRDK